MTPAGALIGGAANVPTARFTLKAGTKVAKLRSELIPQTQTQMQTSYGGFVFVRTTNNVPIYGIEPFFTGDLAVLVNVAAGALAPDITYTPPPPPTQPTCSYSLSKSSDHIGTGAVTGSVGVTASASTCPWTATSTVSWITITDSSSNRTGSGTVNYRVDGNTGSSRAGTLKIAEKIFGCGSFRTK